MSDPLELISGYLDHALGDAELAELEAWILADPKHAATFARRATVHSQIRDALAGEVSLRLSQLRSPELFEPMEGLGNIDAEGDMAHSLSDAMIMEALVESDAADEPAPIQLPHLAATSPQQASAPWRLFANARALRVFGAVAAIIVLGLGLFAWRISSRPVATLTASVGCVWEQTDKSPALGESLSSGKTLQLAHGFAELKYANGAKVVVEAPATVVLSASGRLTLLRGRVSALIPPAAHGFTVSTPAGEIVDLGTEFGVNVMSDSLVETHVFVGKIQVQPKGETSAAPLILTAGQDAHLADTGITVDTTAAEPPHYVRDIHQVVTAFPTHGTGESLKRGDADPGWQITGVPNQTQWQPKPAVVCELLSFYIPNEPRAAWLSTAAKLIDVDAGLYTFKTTFDLSGFVPSSAQLHLRVTADDSVAGVRLNGIPVKMPKVTATQWYRSMYPIDIDGGFVAGQNTLEIVVKNEKFSKVGLKAQLDGTAAREVDQR